MMSIILLKIHILMGYDLISCRIWIQNNFIVSSKPLLIEEGNHSQIESLFLRLPCSHKLAILPRYLFYQLFSFVKFVSCYSAERRHLYLPLIHFKVYNTINFNSRTREIDHLYIALSNNYCAKLTQHRIYLFQLLGVQQYL